MKVTDIYEKPFAYADLEESDFTQIADLVGKTVHIKDAQPFENEKGPGVYILYYEKDPEQVRYTTTHSLNITGLLGSEKVLEAFKNGDTLECTIVKRPSKRDGSKTVFTLA